MPAPAQCSPHDPPPAAVPPRRRIGIALVGKGATNHLHRPGVVAAFAAQGAEVCFLVRDDYWELIERLPGVSYEPIRFVPERGVCGTLRRFCRGVRFLYPARDIGRRTRFRQRLATQPLHWRLINRALRLLACSRHGMRLLIALERLLYPPGELVDLAPAAIDQLLLLGMGAHATAEDGTLTWWARHHGIPVIHMTGNYDNLSSQGFRGVPVERLLVWGPSMRADATRLQGLAPERISEIGSIRYDSIVNRSLLSRADFLASCGFDPARKTILFAGAMMEFHYFEMLRIFEQLQQQDDRYQLILRLRPNKTLLNSPYMGPLLHYVRTRPHLYASIGDPHYRSGARDREVLHIEEDELWNAIAHSDVVVNIFSTMSLEACIFDKPAINMWYFPPSDAGMMRGPEYIDFTLSFHTRRLLGYGAIPVARSPEELTQRILQAIAEPAQFQAQRRSVLQNECGVLDGHAAERLAAFCAQDHPDCAARGR